MEFTERELALIHQALEHSLTHIEEIEDITDECFQEELEALKDKVSADKGG